jgi:hypothetical protein
MKEKYYGEFVNSGFHDTQFPHLDILSKLTNTKLESIKSQQSVVQPQDISIKLIVLLKVFS